MVLNPVLIFCFISSWSALILSQNSLNKEGLIFSDCRISGVFLVQSGKDYKLNYSEAEDACHFLGTVLASKLQVEKANSNGFETCRYGWVSDKITVISRVKPNSKCGQNKIGIIIWNNSPEKKFDAFCFNTTDRNINSCEPITISTSTTFQTKLTTQTETYMPTVKNSVSSSTKLTSVSTLSTIYSTPSTPRDVKSASASVSTLNPINSAPSSPRNVKSASTSILSTIYSTLSTSRDVKSASAYVSTLNPINIISSTPRDVKSKSISTLSTIYSTLRTSRDVIAASVPTTSTIYSTMYTSKDSVQNNLAYGTTELIQKETTYGDLTFSDCRISGVFLVQSGKNYSFNYSEAKDTCHFLGTVLASKLQLEKANSNGFETCRYGWVSDKVTIISRVRPNSRCGQNKTGVMVWYNSPKTKFDAFCFNTTERRTNSCEAVSGSRPPTESTFATEIIRADWVYDGSTDDPRLLKTKDSTLGVVRILLIVLALISLAAAVLLTILYIKKYKNGITFSVNKDKNKGTEYQLQKCLESEDKDSSTSSNGIENAEIQLGSERTQDMNTMQTDIV
ncbi:lymphatic vessel endothelial hyaluronic acid receptor 1 [Protopterus annectens]|uniref:lymphatic vessel endothelial hyaluronic acid receptor 1 n=1 Tax=Protopterus annectens TaxID=7888 RepID=UPI001CFBDF69|nr:lymphatic vessel endothelial hyaluronic acid receptor 1 [Protopterus annectens]